MLFNKDQIKRRVAERKRKKHNDAILKKAGHKKNRTAGNIIYMADR